MHDNIPWQVAIPLAIILWAMFLWMKFHGTQHVQDFFAHRRHVRRTRNSAYYGRHYKKGVRHGISHSHR